MFPAHPPFQPSVSRRTPLDGNAPPYPFSCSRRAESGGSIRLFLSGELDLAESTHFWAALDGAQDDSTRVLLDVRALTLIDCANISIVFAAAERARREGAALNLLDPRGQVRRLFDLIGPPEGVAVLEDGDLPNAGARVAA